MPHYTPLPYCCPGESQPISRALHLGRLASFYPACRACPHRDDTHTLSARQTGQLRAARRRAAAPSLFDDEGAAGTYLNDCGPVEARRLAAALGQWLSHSRQDSSPPEVVIGGDARPLTAELHAAACEALRMTGCNVIDLGFASAGSLPMAMDHLGAGGGLLVGNPTDLPERVGFKFWGGGLPFSAGGGLDDLERFFAAGIDRPGRRAGSLRRFSADGIYLASLRPYFHALRPLRVVLDAASLPLARHIDRLAANSALEVASAGRAARASTAADGAGRQLGQQVAASGAHFGLWIDGDGQQFRLFDERGAEVSGERLTLALFRHLRRENPQAEFVVAAPISPALTRALGNGVRLVPAPPTRQGISRVMRETGAAAGASANRFWFSAAPLCDDALRTFSVLLTLLSASDRHLSEVLDDAGASH